MGYDWRSADLNIIIQRGIIDDLHTPDFRRRPEKPWKGADDVGRYGEDPLDLQIQVSSFIKGAPSLRDLAMHSGIPGQLDVAGDHVAQMGLDGDLLKIAAYTETDALTSDLLRLRMAHGTGLMTTAPYGEEQALARPLMTDKAAQPDHTHLEGRLEAWNRWQTATGQAAWGERQCSVQRADQDDASAKEKRG